MASLEYDSASDRYRVRFRVSGRVFKRSLKTSNEREARAVCGRITETILLVERGRLTIPPDAEPGTFILTDGRTTKKLAISESNVRTLEELFAAYRASRLDGVKARTTIEGEKIHIRHLKKFFGKRRIVQSLTVSDMQAYVASRLRKRWRGKPLSPETPKKELRTFRLIWNWAVGQGHLNGRSPTSGVEFPKLEERLPFMTRSEIELIIDRGESPPQEVDALWRCLFLDLSEITEVLAHVKENATSPFVYPMFVFAAHTGARRSELIRSQIDDFQFDKKSVLIRERKRSRRNSLSFRRVAMSELLAAEMKSWFARHPGGRFTLCWHDVGGKNRKSAGQPLTTSEAHRHFVSSLQDSPWSIVKGFHALRHSFASNAAAAGIDQRMIDEWMGHSTDEMSRRYRHLSPVYEREGIDQVFRGSKP